MITNSITESISSPVARRLTDPIGGVGSASNARQFFSHSGQSLSLGSVGGGGATPSVVSTDSFANSLMFDPGGTRPRQDDSRVTVDNDNVYADRFAGTETLDEVVSSNFGETYNTGIAAQNSSTKILHGGVGRGAKQISELSLGTRLFADLMICINRAKREIEELDETFEWPIHWWAQGEADVINGTNYATYRAALVQYFSDLKTYGNAQLDGTYSPKFICYQMCNPYQTSSIDNWGPADALLDVGLTVTGMFCAGPAYQYTYVDSAHGASLMYRRKGENIGKVISRIQAGTDWKPTHWTNAVRSGSTITLTYHVPVGNLAIDTSNVSDPGDNGFEYSGAGITSVTVASSNTIEIELDASAGGTLGYARTATSANTCGPLTGARGNVRDSDTAAAVHDSFNLYNWACHQEEVIS